MRKTLAATAALTAAVLTIGTAGPAAAATLTAKDPKDLSHGVDLRSVHVRNGERTVWVTTTHTDLVKDFRSGSGGAVFIDTDPDDAGPELVFVGGYFEGTDYQLLHTEGFGAGTWGEPVEGTYSMRVDYAKDQVRMTMSRATLGNPDEVRVAARVAGFKRDGTETKADWLGKPRSFTKWVERG